MDKEEIEGLLAPGCRFAGGLTVLEQTDSTNTRLRALAEAGAPEGTAVLALEQSAGRGTHGRSFWSPPGEGLYLSALLRPRASLEQLLTLTGRAAAAAHRAAAAVCSAPCAVKWLNDLWLNGRKLCGILCELGPLRGDGAEYVIVGIGMNLRQSRETFARQGLGDVATSFAAEGYAVSGAALCAALLEQLDALSCAFPGSAAADLAYYRAHCLTLGRRVRTGLGEGLAVGVDDRFCLVVEHPEGRETVRAGSVTLISAG